MTFVLDKLLHGLLVLCMALMVAVVSWQVVSRYLLGDPSAWTEEVALILLIWVGLLGGVYAYRERAHLGLDIVYHKVGDVGKYRLNLISDLCCGLFALAVLLVGGGILVQLTYELKQTTATLGIPMAWVYSVLPLSGALVVYYSIAFLLHSHRENAA